LQVEFFHQQRTQPALRESGGRGIQPQAGEEIAAQPAQRGLVVGRELRVAPKQRRFHCLRARMPAAAKDVRRRQQHLAQELCEIVLDEVAIRRLDVDAVDRFVRDDEVVGLRIAMQAGTAKAAAVESVP